MKDYTYKIINSSTDTENKISTVTISTPLGIFIGKAKPCEEDLSHYTSQFGMFIAEGKAVIKYFKAIKNNLKISHHTLVQVYNHIKAKRLLEREIKKYDDEIRDVDEFISNLYATLEREVMIHNIALSTFDKIMEGKKS